MRVANPPPDTTRERERSRQDRTDDAPRSSFGAICKVGTTKSGAVFSYLHRDRVWVFSFGIVVEEIEARREIILLP